MKRFLSYFFLLLCTLSLVAWTRYYTDFETGEALMLEDSHENIIIGFGAWSVDSLAPNIAKFDRNGNLLNRASCIPDSFFDGENHPYPEEVIELSEGRYGCLFISYYSDNPWAVYTIVDSTLEVLAALQIFPSYSDSRFHFGSCTKTAEDKVYCILHPRYEGQPDGMLRIIEIDDNCNILNDTLFHDYLPGSQLAYNATTQISLLENETTIQLAQGTSDDRHYALLTFSFEHDTYNLHTYDFHPASELPQKMLSLDDGSFLTLWRWDYYSGTPSDHRLFKYTEAMELDWTYTIADSLMTNVLNVFELSSGNYLVAGFDSYAGGLNAPFAVLEFSPSGEPIRKLTLREELRDSLTFKNRMSSAVIRCQNGDYLFAGNVQRSSAEGRIRMFMRLDSLFNDVPLAPDEVGEAVLVPEELFIALYPNPFNSALAIDAPLGSDITIHDTSGRLIASPGSTWKPEPDTPSGIYLVKATFEGQGIVKKAVYLK